MKMMNLQRFGVNTPVDPTSSNTHVSANFGKLLYPGLNKIFFETYDEIPEQFSKVYNTLNYLLLVKLLTLTKSSQKVS